MNGTEFEQWGLGEMMEEGMLGAGQSHGCKGKLKKRVDIQGEWEERQSVLFILILQKKHCLKNASDVKNKYRNTLKFHGHPTSK